MGDEEEHEAEVEEEEHEAEVEEEEHEAEAWRLKILSCRGSGGGGGGSSSSSGAVKYRVYSCLPSPLLALASACRGDRAKAAAPCGR
jgi:hypothetical protein